MMREYPGLVITDGRDPKKTAEILHLRTLICALNVKVGAQLQDQYSATVIGDVCVQHEMKLWIAVFK